MHTTAKKNCLFSDVKFTQHTQDYNNTELTVAWYQSYDHSMYVSGFSCTPFDSISVISAFWVQMSPAVRTQRTTPLNKFSGMYVYGATADGRHSLILSSAL